MGFFRSSYRILLLLLLTGATVRLAEAQTHFIVPHPNTGVNATVLLTTATNPNIGGIPLENGDEIAVFTPGGLLVGAMIWKNTDDVLVVWGDDEYATPEVIDGMQYGEQLRFRVWDKSAGKEYSNVTVTYKTGPPPIITTGTYKHDAMYLLASLTVNVPPSPPVANNDSKTTSEDTPVVIDVLQNDTDEDGFDLSSLTITSLPANGSAVVDPVTGTVTYTPGENFHGTDTFKYTVKDTRGATSNAATVTVTVTPVNDAPVVANPIADKNLQAGSAATVINLNSPAVFSDVDGDGLTYSVTSSNNAVASASLTGASLSIAPKAAGTATITVTASDGKASVQDQFVVTVTAKPNAPPNAVNDSRSTPEDTPVNIDVLANDSDPDGDALDKSSLTVVVAPKNGSFSISNGVVTYTPNANFFGSDSFTYTVKDSQGATSNVATVTITVTSVNDAPVAVNDAATTNEDVPVQISVLSNDSDVDGSLVNSSVTIKTGPSHGTAAVNTSTGIVTYTPAANYFGTDTFTYTVRDNGGATSNTATVTVTVSPVNDAPVVVNAITDRSLSLGGGALTIDLVGHVLFSDVDGDPLTYSASSSKTSVATTSLTSGRLNVTPVAAGTTTITVTATDGKGGSAQHSFQVTVVQQANIAPVAVNDVATTPEDTPVTVKVLDNDSDPDGDTLAKATVTVVSAPLHGKADINTSTGEITYTPESNYHGTDTFKYTVQDSRGGVSNAANVSITITPVNDAPEVKNPISDASLGVGGANLVLDLSALNVFSDPDGDALTLTVQTSNASVAGASLNGTTLTVTPLSAGTATVSVTARDSKGASAVYHFTVTVTAGSPPKNTAPVVKNALSDRSIIAGSQPVKIDLAALQVFSDADGDPLTYKATSSASHVTVSISGAVLTITPVSAGQSNITVTATDSKGASVTDAFVVTVSSRPNTKPVGKDDTLVIDEDTPGTIDVLANDSDPDGDDLDKASLQIVSKPANGTVNVDRTRGLITYTPKANYYGTDGFTYTVKDVFGATTAPTNVTVLVKAVNDAPVVVKSISDQQLGTKGNTSFELNFDKAGTFKDVDGDQLTYTVTTIPSSVVTATVSRSVLSVKAVGKGVATVTVTATDGSGSSAESSFKVYVDQAPGQKKKVSGRVKFAGTNRSIKNATVIFDSPDQGTFTLTTAEDGSFTTELAEGTYTLRLDVTDPFVGVTAADAALVLRSTAGKKQLSTAQQKAADVNGDGRLDLSDARLITEASVGKLDQFPAGNYFASEESVHVEGSDVTSLVIQAYSYGDVNLSGASSEQPGETPQTSSGQVTVSANIGEILRVPVSFDAAPSIGAFTIGIAYPASDLEYRGIVSQRDGVVSHVAGDTLKLAWFETDDSEPVQSGPLSFSLEFEAKQAIGSATLTIVSEIADGSGTIVPVSPTLPSGIVTDAESEMDLPSTFVLHGNYPNPFNPSTTIRFDLPQAAEVQVEIFDLAGRRVATTPIQAMSSGRNQTIQFDASALNSGVYFYRLKAHFASGEHQVESGRMVLLK